MKFTIEINKDLHLRLRNNPKLFKNTAIYILKDPGTNEVYYVGKSEDIIQRLWFHSRCVESHNPDLLERNEMIIRKYKCSPILEIIDFVEREDEDYEEQKYIAKYLKETGGKLLNKQIANEYKNMKDYSKVRYNHIVEVNGYKVMVRCRTDLSLYTINLCLNGMSEFELKRGEKEPIDLRDITNEMFESGVAL